MKPRGLLLRTWFILLLRVLLLSCLGLTGCFPFSHDVSHNPAYKTGYAVGDVYRVKTPLFVKRESSPSWSLFHPGPVLFLVRPGGDSAAPQTAKELNDSNKQKWPTVAGIVEPGTTMLITKIKLINDFEMGEFFETYARVLNGSFVDRTVEIGLLCYDPKLSMPNTNLVQLLPR